MNFPDGNIKEGWFENNVFIGESRKERIGREMFESLPIDLQNG
jgi:hypothetical protein